MTFVDALLPFLSSYGLTILFYTVLILVIYLFRKKFDWPAKFIGLYRTKIGLKLMDRLGTPDGSFRERLGRFLLLVAFPVILATIALLLLVQAKLVAFSPDVLVLLNIILVSSSLIYFVGLALRPIRTAGIQGVIVGFTGMAFIVGMLLKGLADLVFVPGAPPVISPVLPGVPIPGLGIKVPLIIGWLALFVVIVIHEFSHGVVTRAHKIPVTSSGLMVFGPLGGAFVEPDEKRLNKASTSVKLSIFAAGPFSNLVTSLALYLLLSFAVAPLLTGFVATNGVVFSQVTPGLPAAQAGVQAGVVYDRVDNVTVGTPDAFIAALNGLAPGENVTLASSETGRSVIITATANPRDASRGYLGVVMTTNLKEPGLRWLFDIVTWIISLLTWIFILSLGIGLANLLPLGPVDGGRMLQAASEHAFGEKRGRKVWTRITILMIIIIVILLIVPFVIQPLLSLLPG